MSEFTIRRLGGKNKEFSEKFIPLIGENAQLIMDGVVVAEAVLACVSISNGPNKTEVMVLDFRTTTI